MAEFKLSRLKYNWKGGWGSGTDYIRDDVVRYGGSTWVCIRKHTATVFQTDQNFKFTISDTDTSPAWIKMTDGYQARGNWSTTTLYNPGDIIKYGGNLYLTIESFTSSSVFDDDLSNLSIFVEGFNWIGEWSELTRYGQGDVVTYNGNVYRCVKGHLASTDEEGLEYGDGDQTDDSTLETWQLIYEGIQYRSEFESETLYRKNDVIRYQGSLLRALEDFISEENFDVDNWTVIFSGSDFSQDWNSSTIYSVGSVVRYGGYLFYALLSNQNQTPIDSLYQTTGSPFWQLLIPGVNFRGDWSSSQVYQPGDVVRRGGVLYQSLLGNLDDGSSLDYQDESNWKIVNSGYNWRGPWQLNASYQVGDVVILLGDIYHANFAHVSSAENFPGDNGNGIFFWEIIIQAAGPTVGLRQVGDLLTYNLSGTLKGDQSTFGATNLSIGSEGQIVSVDGSDNVIYRNFGTVNRNVFVTLEGIDDTSNELRGLSDSLAWRTINFACEQLNDGFTGFTTINVGPGVFEEILPISIPARTVILGSELRTTTIVPKLITDVPLDVVNMSRILNRISVLLPTLISGAVLNPSKSAGNPLSQIDPPGITDTTVATDLQARIADYINYIQYHINDFGSEVTVTGSNDEETGSAYENSVSVLQLNKEFLVEETVAYLRADFPSVAFIENDVKQEVRRIIDALIYDTRFPGNYKTILAARRYRNRVLGSDLDDMFYVRDSTGVRNCTLKGLSGILNPPTVFDLYRRPTGGAFVSLDPGWGTADESVWIINRSPYIQGVTTIGSACVGQKIDGSLHAGGNRSIVSNDFTQVISDGVGAWVTNNGLAELVSVFTYYCAIGYLAENGGKIRGTNGNCSYGRYGAVSDGVDNTETPQSGYINTRNNQATVSSIITGTNDEILLFEFENAGEQYSTATANLLGPGVQADPVFEDFRDNAIFEVRAIDVSSTNTEFIGGTGYSVNESNAQVSTNPATDQTGITIASNDLNTEPDYLGKKLIIVSGTGVGQYGIVSAYDTESKIVSVIRESDSQPGWDHIIPGTPSASIFDTSTRYRIEPRIEISHPGFQSLAVETEISEFWIAGIYGELQSTYTNIAGDLGTGVIDDSDGLSAIAARFNVTATGRSYTVTIANPGAGYQIDDVIVLEGTEFGGVSPGNDLRITITGTTDDSTNSITTFIYEGLAPNGLFLFTESAGPVSMYSRDGTNWTQGALPSSGNWKCLAHGNFRFVAIRNGSGVAAYSSNGINWTTTSMPENRLWNSVVYGAGKFVAVAGDENAAAYSEDGITWTSTTLPTLGDSTFNEWISITYGHGKFVAVANSQNAIAYSDDGITWQASLIDTDGSTQFDWTSITYGNGRYVAVSSQGKVAFSFNAIDWTVNDMPTQDGSSIHYWREIKYAQGVFFAVGDTGGRDVGADPTTGESTFVATSEDGIVWSGRTLSTSSKWRTVVFGNPYLSFEDSTRSINTGIWIAAAEGSSIVDRVLTGCRAKVRPIVGSGKIGLVKILDTGSGYIDEPTFTITDASETSKVSLRARISDKVLSQPVWNNRGFGYRQSNTRVSITGNGFADVIPLGKFITISGLDFYPGPGAQLTFSGYSQRYVVITEERLDDLGDGKLSATFRVAPDLKIRDNFEHRTTGQVRIRYSQVRLTGHDFLDIGTGNFEDTNYPEIYSTGIFTPAPENEVYEEGGGRVFYTSTDQSGNYRTGELFAVEQATGIVTISADFFDLSGLSELRLGGIRIGGSGVVIREFSTDALFSADSNNIVPTQRAIAAYLENRLTLGGSEISTASFIAGVVRVGPDFISNTIDGKIKFPVMIDFETSETNISGIRGMMLAQAYYKKSFY